VPFDDFHSVQIIYLILIMINKVRFSPYALPYVQVYMGLSLP